MTATIDPGLVKYRWYRPSDPVFVSINMVDRIRDHLKALDPKLDLWWNSEWKADDARQPGRWAIMYWMDRARTWAVVKYWETADGGYRHIEIDCVEQLKRELAEIDGDRQGQDVKSVNRKAEEFEAARKAAISADIEDGTRQYVKDVARGTLAGDRVVTKMRPSDHHEEWLKSKGINRK